MNLSLSMRTAAATATKRSASGVPERKPSVYCFFTPLRSYSNRTLEAPAPRVTRRIFITIASGRRLPRAAAGVSIAARPIHAESCVSSVSLALFGMAAENADSLC